MLELKIASQFSENQSKMLQWTINIIGFKIHLQDKQTYVKTRILTIHQPDTACDSIEKSCQIVWIIEIHYTMYSDHASLWCYANTSPISFKHHEFTVVSIYDNAYLVFIIH